MPGIIGCVRQGNQSTAFLEKAIEQLSYSDSDQIDPLFSDDAIACQRVHLGVVGELHSPLLAPPHSYCWVEGEMYNRSFIQQTFQLKNASIGSILLEAYTKDCLQPVLQQMDGCFLALIYDQQKKELLFITDRFGLKPFYIWQRIGGFSWSAELKGFFHFPDFPKEINPAAISCFLDCGQLIGDITWFQNVRLLPAATIGVLDIEENIYEEKRYWNWSLIKAQQVSFEEASSRVGDLFKKAVDKRMEGGALSIALSGGLDSRAVVAALSSTDRVQAFTFGEKQTDECRFAQQVARVKGIPYHLFEIDATNWFDQRIEGVWKTDGLISLQHFHASSFHRDMTEMAKICLNGFAGDLILGGSWFVHPDTDASAAVAQKHFKEHYYLQKLDAPFYQLAKEDPYYIDTRVRRFTNIGLEEAGKCFEQRRPFMDHDLIDFIYGLPDHYRQDYRLYRAVFKQSLGEEYASIPWNNTGIPLNNERKNWYFWRRKLQRLQGRLGLGNSIHFTNYTQWLKKDLPMFQKILNPDAALYSQMMNIPQVDPTNQSLDLTRLFRLLTLEIWLQQVFNQQYLTTESLLKEVAN